jgi:poly-beta-1,6-N-acetyl-D-glucosamine synthase
MIALLLVGGGVGFVLYVLAGYPCLLAWWSRRRARPVRKQAAGDTMPVSFLIAVKNGAAYLGPKLQSLHDLDYPRQLMQVLVISDGSTDQTAAVARQWASRWPAVELLEVPAGGKALALNAGLAAARHPVLVFTDVRQPLDPPSLRYLLENFADPTVGVVSGDVVIRHNRTAAHQDVSLYRRYETAIRDHLSALDSMFGATGCYYAIRRELAVPFPAGTLLDDMHQPVAAFFRGYRCVMEARAHAFDEPVALETEFRRKVRTLAGNYQLMGQFPALLGPGNRMLGHFLSYKFGRLMLPYALLLIFVASWWTPPGFRELLLGGQALFYGLALADAWWPVKWPGKKLSSLARTFSAMMLAAFCAGAILFVPADRLWSTPTATPVKGEPS